MKSENRFDPLLEQRELARQLLHLEQQIEAYDNLHREELCQIRSTLEECKRKLLTLLSSDQGVQAPESKDWDKASKESCHVVEHAS